MTGGLAAAGADWTTARRELAAALNALPCDTARTVAAELVGDRIAVLESAHPGDDRARRALGGDVVPDLGEYPGPGANSLVKAVEHVVAARRATGDACREHAAEAIAEAVMGTLVAAWGARHPAGWADWYAVAAHPDQDPDRSATVLPLWEDADVRELAGRQWAEVAARLARP